MAGQRLIVILMYSVHVIQGHAHHLSPPELTVKPSVMSETDTVTLFCHSPLSAVHCYFYTVDTFKTEITSCMESLTLTGSKLLWMVNQRSPAVVEVKCFYTVKTGDVDLPSPHSDTSSITINSWTMRPPVSTPVTPIKDATIEPQVSTPVTPIKGLTIRPHVSTPVTPKKDLTIRPHVSTSVTSKEDLIIKPHVSTPVTPLKGPTVSRPHVSTTVMPTKETMILKLMVTITTSSVVTVVLFLLVLLCAARRSGSKKLKEPPKEDLDIYHLYSAISEEPFSPALNTTEEYDMVQTPV